MDVTQQKKQAKEFVKNWSNRGDERQDSQSFWLDLLEHVLGVENPEQFIHFEKRVKLDNTSFIDESTRRKALTNYLLELFSVCMPKMQESSDIKTCSMIICRILMLQACVGL